MSHTCNSSSQEVEAGVRDWGCQENQSIIQSIWSMKKISKEMLRFSNVAPTPGKCSETLGCHGDNTYHESPRSWGASQGWGVPAPPPVTQTTIAICFPIIWERVHLGAAGSHCCPHPPATFQAPCQAGFQFHPSLCGLGQGQALWSQDKLLQILALLLIHRASACLSSLSFLPVPA
jgi:hypothetical protein